jgi:dTDP-4-dehydrorhamnose 3,5-epimerase
MRFLETDLDDAWLIEYEPVYDERGFFSRTFCVKEFVAHGLEANFVQHSLSYSALRGTLRGMHFQAPPHGEVKVVDCAKGAIWDVIIDIRPHSRTFGQWRGFELTAENRRQLYIPVGFAHGFETLSDNTEVRYLISAFYEPSAARGLRYDAPAFGIAWPLPVAVISSKDQVWPNFTGKLLPRPAGVRVAGTL